MKDGFSHGVMTDTTLPEQIQENLFWQPQGEDFIQLR